MERIHYGHSVYNKASFTSQYCTIKSLCCNSLTITEIAWWSSDKQKIENIFIRSFYCTLNWMYNALRVVRRNKSCISARDCYMYKAAIKCVIWFYDNVAVYAVVPKTDSLIIAKLNRIYSRNDCWAKVKCLIAYWLEIVAIS